MIALLGFGFPIVMFLRHRPPHPLHLHLRHRMGWMWMWMWTTTGSLFSMLWPAFSVLLCIRFVLGFFFLFVVSHTSCCVFFLFVCFLMHMFFLRSVRRFR